jgi:hypothetical protein
MNDQAIHPIQSLLNELASIANSEQTAQTVEQMERTKSLAARLYLELDLAIMESQAPSAAELDEWVAQMEEKESGLEVDLEESASLAEEVTPAEEILKTEAPTIEAVEEPLQAEEKAVEIESEPLSVETPSTDVSSVEFEQVAEIEEKGEPVHEMVAEIAEPSIEEAPKAAEAANQAPEIDANAILMSLSMSRRFEFANFLFGGDMSRFLLFIEEYVRAGASGSSDVYDRWYNECDWKRKDESAADLARSLKRLI